MQHLLKNKKAKTSWKQSLELGHLEKPKFGAESKFSRSNNMRLSIEYVHTVRNWVLNKKLNMKYFISPKSHYMLLEILELVVIPESGMLDTFI